jgi:hypothetical protein
MKGSLVFSSESTSCFANVISTNITPVNGRCVFLAKNSDFVSIDDKTLIVGLEFSIELT